MTWPEAVLEMVGVICAAGCVVVFFCVIHGINPFDRRKWMERATNWTVWNMLSQWLTEGHERTVTISEDCGIAACRRCSN